jgi:hypothetical protein
MTPYARMPLALWGVVCPAAFSLAHVRALEWHLECDRRLAPCLFIEQSTCFLLDIAFCLCGVGGLLGSCVVCPLNGICRVWESRSAQDSLRVTPKQGLWATSALHCIGLCGTLVLAVLLDAVYAVNMGLVSHLVPRNLGWFQ